VTSSEVDTETPSLDPAVPTALPNEYECDVTATDDAESESNPEAGDVVKRISWPRILGFGLLPLAVIILGGAAGYVKFQDGSTREAELAATQSVQAATAGTVAMLSYKPDNVDAVLGAARDRLAGAFRDSYTTLVNDVVTPGAKQKQISATATVPAAASVSATRNHAVVTVFVDQTTIVGTDAPTDTASAIEVTLDKVGDKWLISGFEPK
jgi:Mce-associated membrane protein